MADDEKYKEWLKFLFDRSDTMPEWYWGDYEEFEASDEQKVIYIARTFLNAETDLEKYNNKQVSNGLNYILNTDISDMPFLICQDGVAEELRVNAVLNMKHLYKGCFAKRCQPTLCYLNEAGNDLNGLCYMLWDVSPIRQWKNVVLDVMEYALYIPHNACIESALHGLGHRYSKDKTRVPEIIDRFLSKGRSLRPELRSYAMWARTGRVQ